MCFKCCYSIFFKKSLLYLCISCYGYGFLGSFVLSRSKNEIKKGVGTSEGDTTSAIFWVKK